MHVSRIMLMNDGLPGRMSSVGFGGFGGLLISVVCLSLSLDATEKP
jgi:hypothetical protein